MNAGIVIPSIAARSSIALLANSTLWRATLTPSVIDDENGLFALASCEPERANEGGQDPASEIFTKYERNLRFRYL